MAYVLYCSQFTALQDGANLKTSPVVTLMRMLVCNFNQLYFLSKNHGSYEEHSVNICHRLSTLCVKCAKSSALC